MRVISLYTFRMRERAIITAINPIACDQAGFVTTAQARHHGIAARDLDRLARRGLLRRTHHGVYAVAVGRAPHPHEDAVGSWLAVEQDPRRSGSPRSVVSHASAAAIHAIGTAIPGLPELTQPRQSSRRHDARMHVAPLDPTDWHYVDLDGVSVPLTTPARTIIDLLVAGDDPDHVERAVRDAFNDAEEAAPRLEAAARRRRARSGRLVRAARELAEAAWAE